MIEEIPPCKILLDEFLQGAEDIVVQIGDLPPMVAVPKQNSTGSYGWHLNEKPTIFLGGGPGIGSPARVQANILLTLIGSGDMKAWLETENGKKWLAERARPKWFVQQS